MPTRRRAHRGPLLRLLHAVGARLATALRAVRARLGRQEGVPIEVLVYDRRRRRALERELRWALRRLLRVLPAPLPAGTAVIVQQVVGADRALAGCHHLAAGPDGARVALVRLALEVAGRRLGTDELLAALAEQCLALALAGRASVLVPVEAPRQSAPNGRLVHLHRDPLAPRPGAGAGPSIA
jgi:hypothetical protein